MDWTQNKNETRKKITGTLLQNNGRKERPKDYQIIHLHVVDVHVG